MFYNKNLFQKLIKCLTINSSLNCSQSLRYSSKQSNYLEDIKKCCRTLNISHNNLTETELRNAYLESCKRTHPDLTDEDSQQFLLIESSYHKLQEYLKNKRNESQTQNHLNIEEEEEESHEIRHKVPQHRHYLNYDGVGFGTPSDRLKQYQKQRLSRATDSVHEFQLNKIKSKSDLSVNDSLVLRDANLQRKIKIKHGFERLVEDLIQESMAKGDFENLPGSGKPLKYRPEVPYLDSTTYKLNEILINNGFVPEWVLLQKEIREKRDSIKKELFLLKSQQKLDDIKIIKQIEIKVKELNFEIDKYNTVVPIVNKQQIHFILKNEINKIKETADYSNDSKDSKDSTKVCLKLNFNQNQNKISNSCDKSSDQINVKHLYSENRYNLLKKILSLFS